uniref:DUF2628 domain-containing protein n=1 Tax=Caballeronia sp. LjRoot34 TaxID=3342325 RepID=UPI003F4FEBAF
MVAWPQARQLSGKERRTIRSNIWAFLFGPFYYLFLGMWKKAITLTVLFVETDVTCECP